MSVLFCIVNSWWFVIISNNIRIGMTLINQVSVLSPSSHGQSTDRHQPNNGDGQANSRQGRERTESRKRLGWIFLAASEGTDA